MTPAARAPGPTPPSRSAWVAVTTPMSGRRSWKDAVEEELAPAAERGRVDGGELFTCSPDLLLLERELATADTDRVEEEAVSTQRLRSAGARAR